MMTTRTELTTRGAAIAALLGLTADALERAVCDLLARGFTVGQALDRLVLDWPD